MQPKQALQGKAAQSHQRLIHSHLNQKAGTNSNLQSLKQHPVRTETSVQGIVTDGATADGSEQHSKVTRPSATEVANHLFRILLVSEPLSVADLCKQLPEIPRDSVQNVLEVLQALGIIAQSASIKESTSSRSSSTTNLISMYSLTDYAKFSAPFPITNLETELTNMQEKARTVSARNEQLQELSVQLEDDSLSPEQRSSLLKEGIEKILTRHPQLWEDPLYQTFITHLGCSAQPMAQL